MKRKMDEPLSESESDRCTPSPAPSNDSISTTCVPEHSEILRMSLSSKQIKLDSSFATQKSFSEGGERSNDITNGILFFIAKNNIPFDVVDTEGFRVLMHKTAPLYQVPSRRTITRLTAEKYEVLSSIIKEELATTENICLTTDVWTEPGNTKSFLGLTAHYLVNNTQRSVVIGVEELSERHTSEYLAEKLLQFTSEWNIKKENIIVIISDSAVNIKKAIIDAFREGKHLPCFAHLLNLVPSKIIKNDEVISP
ncbi:zinc finger BED domain-containing protein 1 isoform X2 [Nasonia vitripennis]|nr:zinc finger BED domain-containing protein 1 isoform X2 [Nasonia vitripennis]